MTLPPVEPLSVAGMAIVALFAFWKLQLAPRLERLQRRRSAAA